MRTGHQIRKQEKKASVLVGRHVCSMAQAKTRGQIRNPHTLAPYCLVRTKVHDLPKFRS